MAAASAHRHAIGEGLGRARERGAAGERDPARGQALRTQLQAAAKTSAANFATVAANEKLELKTYANFTLRQPPQDMPYQAIATLQSLGAGDVSEMGADALKGYLVYAQEKKLPDLTAGNPRYVEIREQMMARVSANGSSAYLAELVERELKKTESVAGAQP